VKTVTVKVDLKDSECIFLKRFSSEGGHVSDDYRLGQFQRNMLDLLVNKNLVEYDDEYDSYIITGLGKLVAMEISY